MVCFVLPGKSMALFGNTGIALLQEILGKVKGGIYILESKYDKKGKRLYIGYGTVAPSEKQPVPFSGVSVIVRVISDEELIGTAETEIIKINGEDIIAPQNIVRLFWDITSELSAELESRIRKILSSTAKSIINIKSIDIINPFTIESRTASVRVEIAIGDRRYQEELSPFQIYFLGTKGLFSFLLLRHMQYMCKQTFLVEGVPYIEIAPKSLAGNIPKFLQAMSEVGTMNVLLEDEETIRLKLEELQKKVLGFVKKQEGQIGIQKTYLVSENESEYLISGLELAYVFYIILGTPGRMPITILTWVLDALADEVIKNRLKELDLEVFFGEEEKLFIGLEEDQPEEKMLASINLGFHSNLFEMKVDEDIKKFKLSIQKSISKYDFGNLNRKIKKKAEVSKANIKLTKKEEKLKKETAKSALKHFVLFPAYDSAEKELRVRELAKEITVSFVSDLEEDVDEIRFMSIGQGVLQTIRNMISLHIIWTSKGWVYFQPGTEDQILDSVGKETFKYILDWAHIQERSTKKRWGLLAEYEIISYGDIYSIFKKDNMNNVVSELDHLFALKGLFVRRLPAGVQTWKRKKPDRKEQPPTLQMLEPLVLNPLKRDGVAMFWLKFKCHQFLKKMKGLAVLHGDLFRNIDLLNDLLFIYNSRFGLEIPNSLLIEEIMADLHALENEGILKRYLLHNQPITSAQLKVPDGLSERKALLLQMIPVIVKRYDS